MLDFSINISDCVGPIKIQRSGFGERLPLHCECQNENDLNKLCFNSRRVSHICTHFVLSLDTER